LKEGLPVRLAWYEAVNDFRFWWWVDSDENLPAIFYIRPHKDETIDEHDSRDYKCGDPEYLMDAFYGTSHPITMHDFWKPPTPDPTSYW
jgi:hypothetical protein